MTAIKVSQFVKLVPEAGRTHLPASLRRFKVIHVPWLAQLYYDDKLVHYELAKLPSRYGENSWEMGLHFELRNEGRNRALLTWFDRHLFEIYQALGDEWTAEPWDRGWTKLYVTFVYPTLDDSLIEPTAVRLAHAIETLEPLYRLAADHAPTART